MYRYSVDNAVTYTSEDVVLFRGSPFAAWMERLTLENPDHGIPADVDSAAPFNSQERQDDIAETLRAEGRNVALVRWEDDELTRRADTLEAMRKGVDFVVNGQLALGPLSGSANLLMRTSGYSELGNYLYIPCDTQSKTTLNSGFRLCFLADLLHSLQGQLPPQMLIIRGGADILPLQTEDHIYHYRAVKQRFMEAMRVFRKHRMPDPAESSHFGRWSDCANEVIKQRALRMEREEIDAADAEFEFPVPQVASAGAPAAVAEPSPAVAAGPEVAGTLAEQARFIAPDTYQIEPREVKGVSARTTFRRGREHLPGSANRAAAPRAVPREPAPAEQESTTPAELQPPTAALIEAEILSAQSSIDPAKGTAEAAPPSLALTPVMSLESAAQDTAEVDTAPRDITQPTPPEGVQLPSGISSSESLDAALENLEFIGSHDAAGERGWSLPDQQAYEIDMPESGLGISRAERIGGQAPPAEKPAPEAIDAPPPNLGVIYNPEPISEEREPSSPKPHPLDSVGFNRGEGSFVDRDDAMDAPQPAAPMEPAVDRAGDFQFRPSFETRPDEPVLPYDHRRPFGEASDVKEPVGAEPAGKAFSSSLITNEELED